jgi:hypothetical protein
MQCSESSSFVTITEHPLWLLGDPSNMVTFGSGGKELVNKDLAVLTFQVFVICFILVQDFIRAGLKLACKPTRASFCAYIVAELTATLLSFLCANNSKHITFPFFLTPCSGLASSGTAHHPGCWGCRLFSGPAF